MTKSLSENMFYVDIVNWKDGITELKKIRTTVFIDEQNVPVELEWDGLDKSCTHFVVRENSNAVATARLSSKGQIGRMAVLPDYRGLGIGTTLLLKILSHAKESGFNMIHLHAQTQVIKFYEKHKFKPKGDVFMDAGIPHIEMYRRII